MYKTGYRIERCVILTSGTDENKYIKKHLTMILYTENNMANRAYVKSSQLTMITQQQDKLHMIKCKIDSERKQDKFEKDR